MKTKSEEVLEAYKDIIGVEKMWEDQMGLPEIADAIEAIAGYVCDEDQEKFDDILDKYLSKVDPEEKMTIGEAVKKLGEGEAKSLLKELDNLSYESPDEEDEEE